MAPACSTRTREAMAPVEADRASVERAQLRSSRPSSAIRLRHWAGARVWTLLPAASTATVTGSVIFELVDGQAQHLDAALGEFVLELGGVAQFGGADRGEVLGVAEQHRPGSFDEIVEVDGALGGFESEVRGGIANQDCHGRLPLPALSQVCCLL